MKKQHKNLEYKVWTVRLSDENIAWLKNESKKFGSWNKLFNSLRNNTIDK